MVKGLLGEIADDDAGARVKVGQALEPLADVMVTSIHLLEPVVAGHLAGTTSSATASSILGSPRAPGLRATRASGARLPVALLAQGLSQGRIERRFPSCGQVDEALLLDGDESCTQRRKARRRH